MAVLDFEKPIVELEEKIKQLTEQGVSRTSKVIKDLEEKLEQLKKEIFSNLTPLQKFQLARHPDRPHTVDYINRFIENFIELHGDRCFADDPSIIAGIGWFHNRPVAVMGHEKGRDTTEKIKRNFGMPHPEGYRKALRIMKLAEKFNMPVLSFLDTPGAYPGIGAEERGQAEAIARNLREMARLKVPIIVSVIGEGGSGGALGIGVGDRILMLEFSVYSVISPEGCAAILWKNQSKASTAAEALKLTADELYKLGVVDEVIPEPLGGAHRDYDQTALLLSQAIERHLRQLEKIPAEELVKKRYEKFRRMGVFEE